MQITKQSIELPAAQGLLLERAAARSGDLLQRLQQQGSFRAEVVRAEGQQILLRTTLGPLRGEQDASALTGRMPRLQPGDVIEARIDPSAAQPRLNVLQHRPLQIELRQAALSQQLQQASHPLLAARIARAQDPQQSLLQIGRQQFTIPRDPRLQAGDTVLLRPGKQPGEIHLQRIQPRPLLLQALSRLMPQGDAEAPAGGGLARLQQLARQLLQPNPGVPTAASTKTADSGPATRARPDTARGSPAPTPEAKTETTATAKAVLAATKPAAPAAAAAQTPDRNTPTSPGASPGNETRAELPPRLQNALQVLMKLAIQPSELSPQQLQSRLAQLGLLGGTADQAAIPAPHSAELLPRLIELQALLRDQPGLFDRLLRSHFDARTGGAVAAGGEAPDNAAEWRRQFSQQLDQGIHQLLLGKTGLRLQQDQQQPLTLNLALPLQLPDEPPRELRLRLRQRPNAEDPEQPAWDVRLSFEFGLLGLITVHVLLQERRISAHFWAAEAETWRKIDAELPSFKQQLQRGGFELGLFDCFQGQPKTGDADSFRHGDTNLLDVEA